MPLPAYFICSEGTVVDKESNKVTFFNVGEQIPLILKTQLEQAGIQLPMAPIRLTSAWMKEDNDLPDTQFEIEIVLHFPPGNEIVVAQTTFSFALKFHRIMSPPIFIPGFPEPGVLKIQSRIRRVGESEWIARQFFYMELCAVDVTQIKPPVIQN